MLVFRSTHATLLEDGDGTITSYPGGRVLPHTGILDPSVCHKAINASHGVPGAICENGNFVKVAWNNMKPSSIDEKDGYLSNSHGRDIVKWRRKAKSFAQGYTAFLIVGEILTLSFQNSSQFTNISYSMGISELQPNQYSYIKHSFKQTPDYFKTVSSFRNNTEELPIPTKYPHGAWFYEKENKNITYLVNGIGNNPLKPAQKGINFKVYRCFFEKCIVPTPPPAPDGRPGTARMWSDVKSWEGTTKEYGGYNNKLPADGESVMI